MKTTMKKLLAILMLGSLGVLGLSGCEDDGPAENLGENIDEAAQDAKRGIEDATD